jgi:hypothetical protein
LPDKRDLSPIVCAPGSWSIFSHCGAASAKGRQVLAALASDQPLPDTFTFNYLQGLS